jgi:hypothetical protein
MEYRYPFGEIYRHVCVYGNHHNRKPSIQPMEVSVENQSTNSLNEPTAPQLHSEMQQIRAAGAKLHEKNQEEQRLKGTLSSPEVPVLMALRPLLDELMTEFLAGDPKLSHKHPMEGGLGFTLVLSSEEMWLSKAFYVTAKVADTDGAKVTIQVSDGRWEQVPNYLGSYADWTDQKVVYEGTFDAKQIRQTLEAAFLEWYRHIHPTQSM